MSSIKLPENPNICILRLSAIGDVCHAISTVQAIQAHYPNATITWVIGKIEQQLLKNLPNVHFVVFDKSKGRAAYRDLRLAMKGQKFDVLLQMQLAFRANLAAYFIPATIKLGYSKKRSKELHSLFVNRYIAHEKGFHVLDGFRDFARAIGVEDRAPTWNIPLDEDTEQWSLDTLPTNPYVVISPAASKAERDWLIDRYAIIADYCETKGYPVILTGSPSQREMQLSADIIELCKSTPIDLVGKTNLQQLVATLKNAQLVIAPDSGPAHMAVTQNTKTIGLYAHSNPRRTGPYLYPELVADAYTPLAESQYGKESVQNQWGLRLKGEQLMQAITREQVIQLIDKALSL